MNGLQKGSIIPVLMLIGLMVVVGGYYYSHTKSASDQRPQKVQAITDTKPAQSDLGGVVTISTTSTKLSTASDKFEILNHNYVISDNKLYYFPFDIKNWLEDGKSKIPDNNDFKNFIRTPPSQISYIDPLYSVVNDADLKSIHTLSDYDYVKDDRYVYQGGKTIHDADLNTFQIVNADVQGDFSLAKDMNHVFCADTILSRADPTSFKKLKSCSELGGAFTKLYCENVFSDNSNLYYFNHRGKKGCEDVTVVDRASFKFSTSTGFFDKNDVYQNVQYIELALLVPLHADPKSFQILKRGWAGDKTSLFYGLDRIENSDPGTFELLGNEDSPYAKDKNQVYYIWRAYEGLPQVSVIKGADPLTIKIFDFSPNFVLDKNHLYTTFRSEITPVDMVDAQTFKIDNPKYEMSRTKVAKVLASDKNRKYIITMGDNEYIASKIEEVK